jgi:hypothetical protein
MTQTFPTITTKQQYILKLIYRFLNRTQIQILLNHKDKRRIISWLKDLREKRYVDWYYDANDFSAKTKPAIYYLSLNGIRYLRSLNAYPAQELRKRYKEPARTQDFIDQCLLIADSCLVLQSKNTDEVRYECVLPSDYLDVANEHHYLDELKPHLLFSKQQGAVATNYLLENIPATLPRYQLRKRLKDYVEYLADEWNEANGPLPIVLFICPTTADLLYVKRRVKLLLNEESNVVSVRATTIDKVRALGVASMIWEEV